PVRLLPLRPHNEVSFFCFSYGRHSALAPFPTRRSFDLSSAPRPGTPRGADGSAQAILGSGLYKVCRKTSGFVPSAADSTRTVLGHQPYTSDILERADFSYGLPIEPARPLFGAPIGAPQN